MNEKITRIATHIANERGIDLCAIVYSGTRTACVARYMAYAYLHNNLSISAREIGEYFGRTRINVLRGIRVLKGWIRYHSDIKDEYFSLVAKLEEAD